MSTVLVINAHPLTQSESRTLKALEAFITSYQASHLDDTIERVNLYEDNIPEVSAPLLKGWAKLRADEAFETLTDEEQQIVARFNELTEQFLAADKIVIANALWNLNIPTKLKAWIDTIVIAGTTFKYTENGPVGLIEGKKLVHIQSSGGVYNGQDFASQYIQNIFAFIGVTDHTKINVEGIDHQPHLEASILEASLANAENVAREF